MEKYNGSIIIVESVVWLRYPAMCMGGGIDSEQQVAVVAMFFFWKTSMEPAFRVSGRSASHSIDSDWMELQDEQL
jgi:hypothetical protein